MRMRIIHQRGSGTSKRDVHVMSLTAVTSFVSVIREKTVFVLRLNVKGCQRVAVPITIIVSCLLAIGMFLAAGATDQMVKVQDSLREDTRWTSMDSAFCKLTASKSAADAHFS